jgi:hypothetical protein
MLWFIFQDWVGLVAVELALARPVEYTNHLFDRRQSVLQRTGK